MRVVGLRSVVRVDMALERVMRSRTLSDFMVWSWMYGDKVACVLLSWVIIKRSFQKIKFFLSDFLKGKSGKFTQCILACISLLALFVMASALFKLNYFFYQEKECDKLINVLFQKINTSFFSRLNLKCISGIFFLSTIWLVFNVRSGTSLGSVVDVSLINFRQCSSN